MIEQALAMYRARDAVFGSLPEPQWRILLDLAANGDCSITSAAIASGSPLTTALRHMDLLEKAGFIWRRDDSFDRRRGILSLTEEAVNRFTLLPGRVPLSSGQRSAGVAPARAATLSPVTAGRAGGSGSSLLGSSGAFNQTLHSSTNTEVRKPHHG